MIKTSKILFTLVALSFAASVGLSATKAQTKMFEGGDKDGNGSLSQAEFVATKVAAGKRNAEKNKKEFDAEKRAKQLAKQFAKIDGDGDGSLTAAEFYASFPQKK